MRREIPRNVEVLIKKAAVDPAFKETLLSKRARAADDIALALEPAEAAMLEAVSDEQLKTIIGRTKVSPNLRPVLLGATAGAMLAALAAAAYGEEASQRETVINFGADPIIPPRIYDSTINDPADIDVPDDAGVIFGRVVDEFGDPASNVVVTIVDLGMETATNRYGFYVLTPVPPGFHDLSFAMSGYGKEPRSHVEVREGMKTEVSVKLILGPGEHPVTGIRPDLPEEKGE
ncbi:MAG: carboxypeptidase-like regulatory domain-containing protein [Candidatus Zixiibacteriota bacterium]|jgi:hypothetical protein